MKEVVASDSRHAVIVDIPLEANVQNGFKWSRILYFDTFFHVLYQLLVTENCPKLIFIWFRKVLSCVCDQAFCRRQKNEE